MRAATASRSRYSRSDCTAKACCAAHCSPPRQPYQSDTPSVAGLKKHRQHKRPFSIPQRPRAEFAGELMRDSAHEPLPAISTRAQDPTQLHTRHPPNSAPVRVPAVGLPAPGPTRTSAQIHPPVPHPAGYVVTTDTHVVTTGTPLVTTDSLCGHHRHASGHHRQPMWSPQTAYVVTTDNLCGHHRQPMWSPQTAYVVTTDNLCGHHRQPMWSPQTAYVVTTDSLCGHHRQPMWSPQTTYVVTTDSLCGHHTQPMWSPQTTYVVTTDNLCGHHRQPMWSPQTAYVVTTDNLCGHHRQPMWSPQTAYVVTTDSLCGHNRQPMWSPQTTYVVTTDNFSPTYPLTKCRTCTNSSPIRAHCSSRRVPGSILGHARPVAP
jgi:hypothetical protein